MFYLLLFKFFYATGGFTFGFYYISGLKGQIDIFISFIMPLLIILRASPFCHIARPVRRTAEVSGGQQPVRCSVLLGVVVFDSAIF
jgi:hypothetical protein